MAQALKDLKTQFPMCSKYNTLWGIVEIIGYRKLSIGYRIGVKKLNTEDKFLCVPNDLNSIMQTKTEIKEGTEVYINGGDYEGEMGTFIRKYHSRDKCVVIAVEGYGDRKIEREFVKEVMAK